MNYDLPASVRETPDRTVGIRLSIHPLVALIGVALGTIAAIATVPEDLKSPDSLFRPALFLSLGLALGPIVACWSDPRSILRVENVIGLSPIFWLLLEPLQAATDIGKIAGREQVILVFQAIGLFVGGLWLACMFRARKLPAAWRQSLSYEPNARMLFSLAIAAFALGMLRFAIPCGFNIPQMVSYLGAFRWAAPWGRGSLGGWDAFLDHLAYFGYLVPTLAVLLARKTGWMSPRPLFVLVLSIVMLLFLMQGGGRRIIGVMGGAALVTYVLGADRLRLRIIVVSLTGILAIVWVTAKMLEYRNVGFASIFEAHVSSRSALSPRQQEGFHVDNNIRSFSELTFFIPDKHPYLYHNYFIWVLIRPIPRALWPGKPVGLEFDLPKSTGAQCSLSVTLIGELYMAGGMLMVLLGGLFYGRLAGMASRLLELAPTAGSLLSYGITTLALFAGMRSGIDLVLMLYPLLAWCGLLWFARTHGA
jgi:hypothetical protein